MVNISDYDEGLEYLAKNMNLPFPEDDMEKRKAAVRGIIATLVRQ